MITSAKNPSNFDADLDHGSALEKNPDPGHFFKIYWIFLTKIIFKYFFSLIFVLKLVCPSRSARPRNCCWNYVQNITYRQQCFCFRIRKGIFTVNKKGGGEVYEILNYMRTLVWLRISPPPSGKNSPDPELLNRFIQ